METNDEKWGFMTPFWETLDSLGVSLVPTSIHGSLRISLRGIHYAACTKKCLEDLPRVRDALELVLLMALVDPVEFTRTALECLPLCGEYGTRVYPALYHPDAVIPCELRIRSYGNVYVQGHSESANPALAAKLLSELLIPVDLTERATYQDARKRIFQVIASQHPHKQAEEMRLACERLVIPVEIDLSQDQVTTDMLLTLTRLKHTADERNAASSSNNCAFRMGQVSVRLDTRATKVEQPMALLEESISSGILTLRDRKLLCDDHWVSTSTYAKALSALMVSPGHDHAGSDRVAARPLAKEHTFTATICKTGSALAQLCLALKDCQDIDSLQLTWSDKSHKTALHPQSLCWLVHALFSTSASHSIRHLTLPFFTLSDAAIGSVRLYAQCANPMALLFDQVVWGPIDLQRECQRTPKQVVIAKGTSVSLSASRTRSRDVLQLDKSATCDVLYVSDDFVHIAAPGVGHGRVARSAVVSESLLQPPVDTTAADQRLANASLKSLTMVGSFESRNRRPDFQQLIALLGRGLEQVTIESHDEDATGLMDTILANCPLLKCIRLHHCNLPVFRYFLDAYATGKCKATSLEFMDMVATGHASVTALLDALGDPATKISRALSELSLWRIEGLNDKVLSKAVKNMMATNRTLRLLSVNVGGANEFATVLGSYHGQWIRGCGDPIPIRSKCAFLSVIYATGSIGRGNGDSPTAAIAAMAQLDSSVLAVIFAMAATPVKRQVVVGG